jgi:hypothetical protein
VQGTQPKRNLAAWLAVFFLVGLGAKLWTIQIGATNIPYWDQWDEARLLFKPWLDGALGWRDFFIPHNEHRIVFTRLLDLLEVKLNGQWDPQFQMVVNSVIHLAYGCLLAATIWACTGRKKAGLICCALLPFFALPFAAENTTHGFQSQMYFVDLFSLGAIFGLGFGRPGGGIWIAGFAAAALAIFTMASGFLAAAAVIGLVILRLLKQHRSTPGQIFTLLCGAAVVALGVALKVSVAQHEVLQAQSFAGFLTALFSGLAFPFSQQPVLVLVSLLPLVVLLVKYFQPGFQSTRAAEFVLTFGLWGFLQAATLAYGRAVLADSSRYLDALCTLPMAGVAALFVLAMDFDFRKLPKKTALVGAVLWVCVLLCGLVLTSQGVTEKYLVWSRSWGLVQTENVRAFLATGDAGWLKSDMKLAVPYWNPDWLIDLLRQPKMLSIMPADARPALKLEPDEALSTGFYTNGCPLDKPAQPFVKAWGNFSGSGTLSAGKFVSRPMSASLPKLSVQMYCSSPATKLLLVGAGNRTVELHPELTGRWETLVVDAPANPFVLSVENATKDASVAVGEIKELGRFSVFAQGLINHAVLVLSIGLGLCFIFAVTGLTRPGISLANEGLAWLLVLLVSLTALAGTVCWRNFDSVEYSFALHKKWAVDFVSAGHPGRAGLHLREALWLRPDDVETKKEIGMLKSRGLDEPLPEKIP